MRPRLAISLGDPSGIGPEIVAATLERGGELADVAVFGHWPSLARALARFGGPPPSEVVDALAGSPPPGAWIAVHTGTGDLPLDAPCAAGGESQIRAVAAAADAVLAGRCDALVTGPVSKAAIAEVRPGFTGHTEYLAARCGLGPDDVTMIFAARTVAIGLISTHVPLRLVPEALTAARCERTLRHLAELLSALGKGPRPRIAIAALNPHAGEGGLLGAEENEILAPFCEAQRGSSIAEISGPIPADAIFRDAFAGAYDGVIAAYHDQAMIPLKLAGFGRTANVTAGLPFVRTSPDHGVARDIARTGRADPSGMRLAIDTAVDLWRARRERERR
ncbi:MAG: 4-hydroxythreonine-4-phosphate dehydrogenase PdxA [Proteobacteria bacterium]|nr:4-hydroxythreonine-4-phosphate dehydrogenase PdxA [Pseudomonadota bacterium]